VLRTDLDLSVAMTASASTIACGMPPVNITLYTSAAGLAGDIDFGIAGTMLSAGTVVLGTGAGFWVQLKSPRTAGYLAKIGSAEAIGAVTPLAFVSNVPCQVQILIFLMVVPPTTWQRCFSRLSAVGIGMCTISSVFFCLPLGPLSTAVTGFGIMAGLPRPSAMALATETSMQNKILAIAIILLSFPPEQQQQ
jgi:hypothetical protein